MHQFVDRLRRLFGHAPQVARPIGAVLLIWVGWTAGTIFSRMIGGSVPHLIQSQQIILPVVGAVIGLMLAGGILFGRTFR